MITHRRAFVAHWSHWSAVRVRVDGELTMICGETKEEVQRLVEHYFPEPEMRATIGVAKAVVYPEVKWE